MNKKSSKKGLTILEMMISIAIIAVIFAALLPQFVNINNSWASRQDNLETLQVDRIVTSHLRDRLAIAKCVIAVSDPAETNGFLEYKDIDDTIYRYELSGGNLVFGPVGSPAVLAESVTELQFICYALDDLTTMITDIEQIRFIKARAQVDLPSGRSETIDISVYLRTGNSASEHIIGWWKLDESSGFLAADSSGEDNHGTLNGMSGTEWTGGVLAGALEFDGYNDHIAGIGTCPTGDYTITGWAKDTGPTINGDWSVLYSADMEICLSVDRGSSGTIWFDVGGYGNWVQAGVGAWSKNVWHHLAATWDGTDAHIYVDGFDVPTTIVGRPENARSTPAVIGVYSENTYDAVWYGSLDDIRVYDYALNASEIAEYGNILRYREFTEAASSGDTASITIPTPGSTNVGDLLIAAVATDGSTSASLLPPGGEGWTQINTGNYLGRISLGAWWKLADPSESGSHQFTWFGAEQAYGWMMRFTGHDPASPINTYTSASSTSSTPVSPSVTTTVDKAIILRLGAFDESEITRDQPGLAGHTPITMDSSGTGGTYGISVWDIIEVNDNALIDAVSGTAILSNNNTGKNMVKLRKRSIINGDVYVGPGGDPGNVIKIAPHAQLNGNTGILTSAVTIPSIVAPSLGASSGNVKYSSGTTIINSNIHCQKLTIENSAVVQISGEVNILAEDDVLVDDNAEIQILPGGTLNLYGKTTIIFGGHSKANVNTADPAMFKIYHMGSGKGTRTAFRDNCVVYAEGLGPDSNDYKAKGDAEVFGTYRGKTLTVEGYAQFHVDYGSGISGGGGGSGSGDSVSGGAGYVSQTLSGNSGTSTFSLTAAEEARTITIGISPDTANGEPLLP